ncbi:MAG TPA: hypothetical protein VK813_14205 [Edaphobacter sp.]|nr:hypothetical protein [Edaphobacter sp.]
MNKTIEVIKDIRTLCTHIFEGGHRCASPSSAKPSAITTTQTASPSQTPAGAALAVNPSTSNSPLVSRTSSTPSTK